MYNRLGPYRVFMVKRTGTEEPIRIYADELQEGDEIIFDNKDILFTINEL